MRGNLPHSFGPGKNVLVTTTPRFVWPGLCLLGAVWFRRSRKPKRTASEWGSTFCGGDRMAEWTLYEGDCLEVMRELPSESVDAVVTDPPYGLGFMGKEWDRAGIAYQVSTWQAILRVLKPGGHLLAFGGSRTHHRMMVAIEDAGFEIRDCLMWLYGSGFPKSLDVSKAIDQMAGAERRVVGSRIVSRDFREAGRDYGEGYHGQGYGKGHASHACAISITAPATEAARQWEGWGTALKPANEPIVLARKPISEKTIAENVLKWGTGGLNIDECRIPVNWKEEYPPSWFTSGKSKENAKDYWGKGNIKKNTVADRISDKGRFPANVILDEEAGRMLDEQQDGASRFFYVAKASRSERTMNGKIVNNHPTVKPIKLMRYLCRLITPPGGTVLDPFAGSGTTLLAAVQEGFSAIGIEREPEYCDMIRKRMAEVQPALPLAR